MTEKEARASLAEILGGTGCEETEAQVREVDGEMEVFVQLPNGAEPHVRFDP